MAILAPELLHIIVSQVALEYVYYPDQGVLKKDIGTLRSLRLACRKLCEVTSEYLFEEVTLYFTEASHAKMLALAQHPTYSTYVRSIGIAPKAISGPFLDRNAFGQWFHHARPLVLDDNWDGFFGLPARMSYLPTKEARVIDFHHAQYTSLYEKQEQLSGKAEEFLKTAIGCFSRLEKVESSVRTPPTAYSVPSTNDAFISDVWQGCACLYKYDLNHGAMILAAVSQGRSLAGTQVEIGDLFYKLDTMVMDLLDPVAFGQIQSLVADSKKLNLSIQTSDFPGLRQLLDMGRCGRFLGLMKNLESIDCSTYKLQYTSFPHITISDVFGDNTWQQLRRLNIGRFRTSASVLSKLLSRHKSTLKNLTLQHIVLHQGSWHDVFVKLRRGALRIIKVHRLGRGNHTVNILENCDSLRLEPISSSHPLHAYLFRGASWVPSIEAMLEDADTDSDDMGSDAMSSEDSDEDDDEDNGEDVDVEEDSGSSETASSVD